MTPLTDWSLAETQAVIDMLTGSHATLRAAIHKLFTAKSAQMQANCTNAMATVPREIERAADFAAKAEAYRSVIDELRSEAEHQLSALHSDN